MELRHYIDGVQVEEPAGWGDFTEDIKRNYKLRMIGTEYPIDITFVGGGYAALSDLYAEDPCGIVTYVVKQDCGDGILTVAIRSSIVLADIEFNLDACEARVKATDDGIGARIANNAKVEVRPGAAQTKNGLEIDAAASFDLSLLTISSVPPNVSGTRIAYDWKELMRHCVEFITDLNVTIVSDWYDALPDDERYAIIDGLTLRTGATDSPNLKYTFDALFNNLGKKYNLWISATRDADGGSVLRIEPEATFYGAASGLTLPNTRDLIRKVFQERLYASVKVGSKTYIKDTEGDYTLPFIVLRGFTEETFRLNCQCNTDEELDLVTDWVIDNNVIEACSIDDVDDYDEDIFLIQYTESTTTATADDYLLGGVLSLYNTKLQNFEVINRFYFHCDLAYDQGANTGNTFLASITNGSQAQYSYTGSTVGTAVDQQVGFNNDYTGGGFDNGNHYGNGTTQGSNVATADSRYTATQQGFFYFTANLLLQYAESGAVPEATGVRFKLYMRRYDSSNALIYQTPYQTLDVTTNGASYGLILQQGISMNSGDYVTVGLRSEPIGTGFGFLDYTIETEVIQGFFSLEASTLGGGTVNVTDPEDFKGALYQFERHCTLEQWKALVEDHSLSVSVGTRGTNYAAFPRDCSRNLKTGETKWELIASA